MARFTYIDLFAGIGGFHKALSQNGGDCIGFSEINHDAIDTYCTNYNMAKDQNFGDITKLESLPYADFITAGVPCQSWSIAGKKLGFDDDRGQLWNDTIYMLAKVQPKCFIFENVKGLADPRNKESLEYILNRIKDAGYYANIYLLNAYDYGVPQHRIRMYIIGFKDKLYSDSFRISAPNPGQSILSDIINPDNHTACSIHGTVNNRELSDDNEYFLFNDIRNGNTTIHSWEIQQTSEKEKTICNLLLKNRRKKIYGNLDGNPLSIKHFQTLDSCITETDLEGLVDKKILKQVPYTYLLCQYGEKELTENDNFVLSLFDNNTLIYDNVKNNKELKKKKIDLKKVLNGLVSNGVIKCIETRYDFKNSKISTGINGINRIFLLSSKIFPTLVASDTNDFVATKKIDITSKQQFIKEIYNCNAYRKITKSEACMIQGFPSDFILPDNRQRWMHLIGNSVAVPVIDMLVKSVINTGVFD